MMEVANKRKAGRLRPRSMSCNLGQVVDFSLSGMRVLSRRQLRGGQTVVLSTARGEPLRLQAKVVWHRRHAAGEHVHGLRFEGITPQQREQLVVLMQLISTGQAPKGGEALSRLGLSGLFMLAAALVLMAGWYAWTRHNPAIEAATPQLHNTLSAVPELGAILAIAAGGCALLAVFQRVTTPSASQKPLSTTDISPVASQHYVQTQHDSIRRSQSVLNGILNSSLGGVVVLESVRGEEDALEGLQIQLVNPAGETLLGKPEHLLVGQTLEQSLPCLVKHGVYHDLIGILNDGEPVQKEYQIGGDGRWYLVAMVKLADGLAVTFLDNTESQQHREQLQHIAYHDELTGLPNRKALIEHVDTALMRSRRAPGHRSAILFLDFDRFKHVNDTLGHEAGDQMLVGIAERLRENLRETDAVRIGAQEQIPARLGGDEFVVLLDGISGTDDATAVAKRLLKVFAQPHAIAGQQVVSTASIGIAINDGGYDTADDILRDADSAMYTAKQAGKGRYVLFDQHMQKTIQARLRMEQDLRSAVDQEQFALVYEPIVELKTGAVAGFEALIRWNHPEHGIVSPTEFIPLAEDLNLIAQIGGWVIKNAAAQLADWRRRGIDRPFVNFNLSRGQLYEPGLVPLIRDQIATHELQAGDLRAELTETMVMNDLDFMANKLAEIKDAGLGLALDDFGTGYSSLNVLHRLPFDTLKIDRAFLDYAREAMSGTNTGARTRRSGAIIESITNLARNLGLEVIAEGASGPDQVALLQALDCTYAQGWQFSKPLTADEAAKLCAQSASKMRDAG